MLWDAISMNRPLELSRWRGGRSCVGVLDHRQR
jgi:hypothetical protein